MVKRLLKTTQRKLQKYAGEGSIIHKPYVFLLSFLRPLYFSNEFLMVNGFKKKSKSSHQSIIFFSTHKAASTFVRHIIMKLVNSQKLLPIRFNGFLPREKQTTYYNNSKKLDRLFIEKGYVYSVFREYYHFPFLDKYKIVLVLRDPRDVLTSQYFSVLYNHPLSRKEVVANRKKFKDYSIDDFVREFAPELQKKYSDYCKHLLGKENVLLLKYEDMITQFDPWLRRLAAFLDVSNSEHIINKLVSETSFKVEKEDPHSFIRNIKAGDHLNKLKPETIEYLTNLFKHELVTLNYL